MSLAGFSLGGVQKVLLVSTVHFHVVTFYETYLLLCVASSEDVTAMERTLMVFDPFEDRITMKHE